MNLHLLLSFGAFLGGVHARVILPDHFFPVPTTLNNETSEPIYLRVNFTLFEKTTDHVIVSENGVISFPKGKTESFPKRGGSIRDGAYLSVFWTDHFPQFGNGEIYYGEYNSPEMLAQAKETIDTVFQCEGQFQPESVFVATWHNVRTRFECVQEYSIEYCDCLDGDGHWGDVKFCECRQVHSKQYCERCSASIPDEEIFCACLDDTDNYDYCQCVKSNSSDCSCLKDHDSIVCDCLTTTISPEHAWNCSCLQKYDQRYCDCLLTSGENHDYCNCLQTEGSNCGCYLYRSKVFCDCYRVDKNGNEGYCDCIDQGKDFAYCSCMYDYFSTFYDDNYKTQAYCDCLVARYSIDTLYPYYCFCITQQDPRTCEEDEDDRKRALYQTPLQYAQLHGLVRAEGSSYQAVLISGGGRSFVIYNYGYFSSDIEKASIDLLRLEFYSAFLSAEHFLVNTVYVIQQAKHLSVKYPWNLLQNTNSGVPGQYIYRTDQDRLEEPDCTLRGVTAPLGSWSN